MKNLRAFRWLVFGGVIGIAAVANAQTLPDPDAALQEKITALEKLVMAAELPQESPAPASTNAPSINAPAPDAPLTNAPSTNAPAAPLAPFVMPISRAASHAVQFFYTLRQDTLRHDYPNAIAAANNLKGATASTEVQIAVADLLPDLQKLRDAQGTSINNNLKTLLDATSKALATAKDPKELDPIVEQISTALADARKNFSGTDRMEAEHQLQDVSRFVREWQNYLADLGTGNSMQAGNDLRNLSNSSQSYMPIPRSEILGRAAKLSATPSTQVIDTQVEVHSFDDIPAALAKLQTLMRSGGGFSMDFNNMVNSLQNLQTAWLAYQDKNYSSALQSLQNYPFGGMVESSMSNGMTAPPSADKSNDSLRKQIMALKDTLLLDIAQGLLALPDAPAPQDGEHAGDYVLRVAGLKKSTGDWEGLMQVLTIYQQVSGPFAQQQQAWLQEDLTGLHAYLVGEKLEGAGQDLDAIRSYRQALATLGKYFPADPPAAKLKALQKSYPQLYDQALQQPIGPKAP